MAAPSLPDQAMNAGRTVFSQIMDVAPWYLIDQRVSRYGGTEGVRSFSCRDQFLSMAFAQLTQRESLRDIEACLRARDEKLYHMGFRGRVSRNTLAVAMRSDIGASTPISRRYSLTRLASSIAMNRWASSC